MYLFFSIILILFIILVAINIQSRLDYRRILSHLIITSNYYERILLLKKVISYQDIIKTRQKVKEKLGIKNYERIKEVILEHDDEYLKLLADVVGDKRLSIAKKKREKKIIGELIYHRKSIEALKHFSDLRRRIVLK
jgi:hypothetical protein